LSHALKLNGCNVKGGCHAKSCILRGRLLHVSRCRENSHQRRAASRAAAAVFPAHLSPLELTNDIGAGFGLPRPPGPSPPSCGRRTAGPRSSDGRSISRSGLKKTLSHHRRLRQGIPTNKIRSHRGLEHHNQPMCGPESAVPKSTSTKRSVQHIAEPKQGGEHDVPSEVSRPRECRPIRENWPLKFVATAASKCQRSELGSIAIVKDARPWEPATQAAGSRPARLELRQRIQKSPPSFLPRPVPLSPPIKFP
jgi:hypothetical protein